MISIKRLVFTGLFVVMIAGQTTVLADTNISYEAALQKAIHYARARNYKRALKFFKLVIKADPISMDPYFNVGNIARHFKRCKDQLLYFQGFIYLAAQGNADANYLKTAKSALNRCSHDPKTGYLTITTNPPSQEVTINGALVGKTPINKLPLIAGSYTYSIKNPLFEPFSDQFEIKARESVDLQPKLVKKVFYGWLAIKTLPKKGVQVFLGDKAIGTTPLKKVNLKTGKYLVRLKAPGYDLWQRYIEINKDKTTTVDAQMHKPVKHKKINMDQWKRFTQ